MAAERRYQMVFLSAIVVAVLATFGVYRVLQQSRESNRIPMVPVLVAANDLGEGRRIERLDVTVGQWPAASAPAGAFASPDSIVGRVTRMAVFKGEPIVPGRLAPPGTGPGLEVKINDVAGIAGLIQPNSRVDVLVTLKEEDQEKNRQRAKVFMSNMRVLSVGTQVERGSDGNPIQATVAALEVTPDESERLAVAANQGTIQLVLRGYGDPDSIKTKGATSTDVFSQLATGPVAQRTSAPRRSSGPRRPAPVAAPAPPVVAVQQPRRSDSTVVRVFRGDKVSQQKFEKPAENGSSTGTP